MSRVLSSLTNSWKAVNDPVMIKRERRSRSSALPAELRRKLRGELDARPAEAGARRAANQRLACSGPMARKSKTPTDAVVGR